MNLTHTDLETDKGIGKIARGAEEWIGNEERKGIIVIFVDSMQEEEKIIGDNQVLCPIEISSISKNLPDDVQNQVLEILLANRLAESGELKERVFQ